MSIQGRDRLISGQNQRRVWDAVLRIQQELALDDPAFSEVLGLTREQFTHLRDGHYPLAIKMIASLCDHLGLSLSHFMDMQIDYEAVRSKFLHLPPVLPARYTADAYGNLMTFRAAIRYLAAKIPPATRNLLSTLQIDPRLLRKQNASTHVNISFYEDACQKMSEIGLEFEDFREIGVLAAHENLSKLNLAEQMKEHDSRSSLERSLLLALAILDRNHVYRIEKISSTRALVSAYPTEQLQDSFRRKIVGNVYTSIVKEGVFSGVPIYAGEKIRYRTHLIRSIHRGDPTCLYEINVL